MSITLDHQCKSLETEASAELQRKGEELIKTYDVTGSLDTLSQAIDSLQQAACLRPPGHSLRASTLVTLADALKRLFLRNGDSECCAQSVVIGREALGLCRREDPLRIEATVILTNILRMRYDFYHQMDHLEEALALAREGLDMCPVDNPSRFAVMGCLANTVTTYGYETGNMEILGEAIQLRRESLRITPPDCSLRIGGYNAAALVLFANYDHSMNIDNLEEATVYLRDAVALCPTSNPIYPALLHNLAIALHKKFMRNGCMDTLAEATQMDREALRLVGTNELRRGMCLGYLAEKLVVSFDQTGDSDVLSEAIELQRKALTLFINNDKERYGSLMNLAQALERRWVAEGKIMFLEEAIGLHREALCARSEGHINHTKGLSNLGNALCTYANILKDTFLLEDAIKLHRAAVRLLPPNAPTRSEFLTNLARALSTQFELEKRDGLLAEAISLHQEALDLRVEGHPLRHASHHFIARLLLLKSSHHHEELALSHLSSANLELGSLPRKRLHMMIESLPHVERSLNGNAPGMARFESALDVYVQAVNLLPHAAHFGLNLPSRLRELAGSEDLCRTSACRALLLQQDSLAIEIIEKGKTAFWSRSLNLRTRSMDLLPLSDQETLSTLFSLLEQNNLRIEEKATSRVELENLANKQRQLNLQAETLINDIRSRPGFERFLDTPSFSELALAAANGPVVFLFGTGLAYFALILMNSTGFTKCIELSNANISKLPKFGLQGPRLDLRNASYNQVPEGLDTSARLSLNKQANIRDNKEDLYTALTEIWNSIVFPIIDFLNFSKMHGRSRPRVHWCPSGEFTFLPLHAAGIYHGTRPLCTSDFIVSSYTPSLSALIKSRQGLRTVPWPDVNSLLVSVPHVPHLPPLPKADEEIQLVGGLLRMEPMASDDNTSRISVEALVKPVMDKLPSSHILHLACHGLQHKNPLKSHFVLSDGPLSIEDLMSLNLPNAMFAFLSACDTAKGDRNQPDQAVHLAASLLFCGFRSVIGTMWSMGDIDGPAVASQVFEQILKKDVLDLDDVPYAVDRAVALLRERGAPPSRWATFIHIGA